jgi:hypothetical protein
MPIFDNRSWKIHVTTNLEVLFYKVFCRFSRSVIKMERPPYNITIHIGHIGWFKMIATKYGNYVRKFMWQLCGWGRVAIRMTFHKRAFDFFDITVWATSTDWVGNKFWWLLVTFMSCSNEKTILLIKDYKNQDV